MDVLTNLGLGAITQTSLSVNSEQQKHSTVYIDLQTAVVRAVIDKVDPLIELVSAILVPTSTNLNELNMASEAFSTLPEHTKKRIDKAYRTMCRELPGFEEPPSSSKVIAGGGFIVEDDLENEPDVSDLPNVPMSSIPSGLRLLELPTDDVQVLTVFRQAASGWDENAGSGNDAPQSVTADDWRAVCGVLLEHHGEEYADSSSGDEAAAGSDFQIDEEEHASDEDYIEDAVPRQRRTRTSKSTKRADESDSDGGNDSLMTKQRQTCLEDFALFFPEATREELPQKKIMISDIQRVAQLLKEKLKAEDIVEMLDAFSSSADKSVNLEDFQRIMLAAKFV